MDKGSTRAVLFNPGTLAPELERVLDGLEKDSVVARIWGRDATVWKREDREISNRLGWLASPLSAAEEVPGYEAFAASLRGQGLRRAVVLGMGGSSLAPEVFARMFLTGAGGLDVEVLDTTEPGAVAAAASRFEADKTLFIVSSKSGTTAELVALFSFFYDRARRAIGESAAGSRFVAVTDPGTPLATLAAGLGFRAIFPGRPDIGGRFSALTAFGLLPAALKGIELARLLDPARIMAEECRVTDPRDNPGAFLGAILGAAARSGRDKLTFLVRPPVRPLADWLEQLIAESTGKEGRGILPVIEDVPSEAAGHGRDRIYVDLVAAPPEMTGSARLAAGDVPVLRVPLFDPSSLGAHFFLWEFATAIAGRVLGINPFDQPDVESTKKKTREILDGAGPAGRSTLGGPALVAGGLRFISPDRPKGAAEALSTFLGLGGEGDYIAVLAYLPRTEAVERLLSGLSASLRRRYRLPVTVGFGPRYLHSTGQLHKGDGNRGLFLQLAALDRPDVPIPAIPGIERPAATFADLYAAQSRGDWLALADKGRRILRVEIEGAIEPGLERLMSLLG